MNYPFRTKPFAHQLAAFEVSHNKRFFALLMEMGTGKSKVLLDTIAWQFDQGFINAALICANKGAYMNWTTNEIPTHFVQHIPLKACAWKATERDTPERVEFLTKSFDGLKIFVVNTEALAYPRSSNIISTFVKSHRCLMAVDESSQIRSPSARRTKTAIEIGRYAKATRILTGSVVDNRPLDAYTQFDFLSHGSLGFTSYFAFRAQYANLMDMRTNGRTFKVVKGFRNLEDLRRRMSANSYIIKKADCLDLPPKIYQTIEVGLTEEQAKHYADLKKRSLTQIEGELCTVTIILTKLLRLHQLVCGNLVDDDGNLHPVSSNRIPVLMDILEETQGQVIIWATYRADIFAIKDAIAKEYGVESVLTYFGDTNGEERDRAKRVFYRGNDTEGVRFLVSNAVTGGYGNNFTGSTTHIYYSNNFNAETRNQSEDRSHRIGQTERVTYIDLVCPGTIDEKIIQALKEKKSLSDTLTVSNFREFF